MAKWTDDAIVVIDDDGPVMGVVLARGIAAAALFAGGLTISKARLPEYRRIGKEWRRVRVRVFHALGDESRFWTSGGYYTWSRLEWMALWCRATDSARDHRAQVGARR